MKPEDVPAELAEKMARARISAQHGRPLTDAEWSAVRSRIEETWIASALAAVLPDIQAQVLNEHLDKYQATRNGMGHSHAAFWVLQGMADEVARLTEGSQS